MREKLEQLLKSEGFKMIRKRSLEDGPYMLLLKKRKDGKEVRIRISEDSFEEYDGIKTREYKIVSRKCEECGSTIKEKEYFYREPTQREKDKQDKQFLSIMMDMVNSDDEPGLVIE
jgi:hypothetical protein